jgi:hypothetical protein
MALVGTGGYLQWATTGGLVRNGNWVGLDFHVYYTAALVLHRGEDIYRAGISPLYIYPPLLAALVVPLTLLPPITATIVWKLLQHAGLLLAGGLLVSLLPARVRPLAAGVLLLGGLTPVVQDELQLGEVNSLILLLESGAIWLLARQGHDRQRAITPLLAGAGILLGLATGIKVLPVLLVAYFWLRGPRGVALVATASFLLLQVVSLILTPATADYWLIHFPALFGESYAGVDNQSLTAAISRALLPGADPGLPITQLTDGAAWRPALTALANGLLLATGAVLIRAARRPTDAEHSWYRVRLLGEVGLVLLTTHLISGSTWLHHLVDLAVPLAALLGGWWLVRAEGNAAGRAAPVLLLVVGGVLALLLPRPAAWVGWAAGLAPDNAGLAWLASNIPLWTMLGLWIILSLGLIGRIGPRRFAAPASG